MEAVGQLVESDRAAEGKTLVASKSCVTSVGSSGRARSALAVNKSCASSVERGARAVTDSSVELGARAVTGEPTVELQ